MVVDSSISYLPQYLHKHLHLYIHEYYNYVIHPTYLQLKFEKGIAHFNIFDILVGDCYTKSLTSNNAVKITLSADLLYYFVYSIGYIKDQVMNIIHAISTINDADEQEDTVSVDTSNTSTTTEPEKEERYTSQFDVYFPSFNIEVDDSYIIDTQTSTHAIRTPIGIKLLLSINQIYYHTFSCSYDENQSKIKFTINNILFKDLSEVLPQDILCIFSQSLTESKNYLSHTTSFMNLPLDQSESLYLENHDTNGNEYVDYTSPNGTSTPIDQSMTDSNIGLYIETGILKDNSMWTYINIGDIYVYVMRVCLNAYRHVYLMLIDKLLHYYVRDIKYLFDKKEEPESTEPVEDSKETFEEQEEPKEQNEQSSMPSAMNLQLSSISMNLSSSVTSPSICLYTGFCFFISTDISQHVEFKHICATYLTRQLKNNGLTEIMHNHSIFISSQNLNTIPSEYININNDYMILYPFDIVFSLESNTLMNINHITVDISDLVFEFEESILQFALDLMDHVNDMMKIMNEEDPKQSVEESSLTVESTSKEKALILDETSLSEDTVNFNLMNLIVDNNEWPAINELILHPSFILNSVCIC